ncbi:MAG TPA: hypothetical protein VMI55_02440 [Thermoplasmata archaeon]|nr:hypothetical protein [Thermoplasmata archaeon]
MEAGSDHALTGLAFAATPIGIALLLLGAWLSGIDCWSGPVAFSTCPLSDLEYTFRAVLLFSGGIALGLGLGLLTQIMVEKRRLAGRRAQPRDGPPRDTGPPPKRSPLTVTMVCVAVAVATLVALVVVPVPQGFTMHDAAIYDLETDCPGIYTSPGTVVSFHWSAGSFTYFFVVGCPANEEVYDANGTSGSGSFISSGGIYEFGGSCPSSLFCVPANVSGTYTGPIIPP